MIYLGHYEDSGDAGKRHCSPAAISKMDYLRDVLINFGYPVEIVSLAPSRIPQYLKTERRSLKGGGELVLFTSLGYGNKIKNRLNEYFIKVHAIIYLLKKVKRNDTVIVYHSLALITVVNVMRMIKKCDVIYDVGELYYTVVLKKEEKEMAFLKTANAYIFSTEFLDKKINNSQKPYVLLHGSYCVAPIVGSKLFDDNKMHCVYAGTFDIRKGVFLAIHSAFFLDSRYHIHILGFGTDEETKSVKKIISDVSLSTDCKISYEGVIHGEEYIRFLQSCQIGLSPQSPDAQFNEASFPSKTLSYLSNGLKVVSIRIPAIEQSNVGAFLYYYDKQTPEAFAKAIEAAARDMSSNGQVIVKNLDEEFKKGLRICYASLNRKAKTKGSENMRKSIVGLINRYEFVSGFISLIYRLFSMNRIRNRKGLRLVCNGAFIKRTMFMNYGHNNTVIIGKGCRLNTCKIELYGSNNRIVIGQKCFGINVGLYASDGSTIKIGNKVHFAGEISIASLEGKQVCIGDDCLFSSEIRVRNGDSHSIIDQSMKRVNPAADIVLGQHVWIGQQVIILKGTMIDRDCVVGIRSLVTGKRFEAGSIIAGSPARVIRDGITWVYDMV